MWLLKKCKCGKVRFTSWWACKNQKQRRTSTPWIIYLIDFKKHLFVFKVSVPCAATVQAQRLYETINSNRCEFDNQYRVYMLGKHAKLWVKIILTWSNASSAWSAGVGWWSLYWQRSQKHKATQGRGPQGKYLLVGINDEFFHPVLVCFPFRSEVSAPAGPIKRKIVEQNFPIYWAQSIRLRNSWKGWEIEKLKRESRPIPSKAIERIFDSWIFGPRMASSKSITLF